MTTEHDDEADDGWNARNRHALIIMSLILLAGELISLWYEV